MGNTGGANLLADFCTLLSGQIGIGMSKNILRIVGCDHLSTDGMRFRGTMTFAVFGGESAFEQVQFMDVWVLFQGISFHAV